MQARNIPNPERISTPNLRRKDISLCVYALYQHPPSFKLFHDATIKISYISAARAMQSMLDSMIYTYRLLQQSYMSTGGEGLHYVSREQRLSNVRQTVHGELNIGDCFPGAQSARQVLTQGISSKGQHT